MLTPNLASRKCCCQGRFLGICVTSHCWYERQLDQMGCSGSDACEEPIRTRWQLDLVVDPKADFEGVGYETDMVTHECFLTEDNTVSKTALRTRDSYESHWRRAFSHAQGKSGKAPPTISAVLCVHSVGGHTHIFMYTNIYIYIYIYIYIFTYTLFFIFTRFGRT